VWLECRESIEEYARIFPVLEYDSQSWCIIFNLQVCFSQKSAFLALSGFNTDLDTQCPLLAKGKNAKAD